MPPRAGPLPNAATLVVRPETSGDIDAIRNVTRRAFAGKGYSDGTEPQINDDLRRDGALALSLVGMQADRLMGHVAFSAITIDRKSTGFFALGPISVDPTCQKQGIGTALIREGLHRMHAMGAQAIILLGDPRYYQRHGFQPAPTLTWQGASHAPHLQMRVLTGEVPQGDVAFHPAFGDG